MKKSIMKLIGMMGILVLVYSCQQKSNYNNVDEIVAEAMETTQGITAEQLHTKIDNGDMILLIDTREPAEFNAGYIPGAVNIPRGVLEFEIDNEAFWDEAMLYMPEKEEEIIIYCKKGKRSILAACTLKKLGYKKVYYLSDGWKNWEMNYPLMYEKNPDQSAHTSSGESGGC